MDYILNDSTLHFGEAKRRLVPGAPHALSIELFLPWIHKIMLAYQDEQEPENDALIPHDITFSKAYYTKKLN